MPWGKDTDMPSPHMQEPLRIDWIAFWSALILSPLLVTLATFWITPLILYVLVFGAPIYLIFGIPLLIRHLRRHPPQLAPIVTLALISLLGLVPVAAVAALISGTLTPLKVVPFLIGYGAIFAGAWAVVFTLLYQRLRRFP